MGRRHTANVDTLPGARHEVKKQVLKNLMNSSNILTTSAFVFVNWKSQRKTIGSSKGSKLYHKAREHYRRCCDEKATQKHSQAISEGQLVSTEPSVTTEQQVK